VRIRILRRITDGYLYAGQVAARLSDVPVSRLGDRALAHAETSLGHVSDLANLVHVPATGADYTIYI
jgi:hypothetical protein